MQIVPVIDLKGGIVVHARQGERANYRPIETPLAPSSDPLAVAHGLFRLHPFDALYVADLDAIERQGGNHAALAGIRAAFPRLQLWVDNGIADLGEAQAWLEAGLGHLVVGSEAQRDASLAHGLAADTRAILSLDFRLDAFQGPHALLDMADEWPQKVIVMTLARVGSGAGPDLERLRTIRGRAGSRAVFAAGGVRDASDLAALQELGCAGALVASALHDGRLAPADLARFR